MRKILLAFIFIAMFSTLGSGQIRQTENTLKLAEGQIGERATIAHMSWLAGTWTGNGPGGGISEETWSTPSGGAMMGMFRLLKDGKVSFFELITLVEKNGTLLMRLRHFSEDLVAWEEKDKTVDFRFVRKDGNRIYFEGMTYELVGKKAVKIYLAFRQKDGSAREEIFEYKRVK